MSSSLFTCEAQSAVILVSDDPLYALGPVLVADDVAEAYEAMAAFVDALGRPADEIPTIALMTEWQAFLTVVSGRVIAPLDAVSGATDGDGGHLDEDVMAEATETAQEAPGGSEDYSPDPTTAGPPAASSDAARPAAAESTFGTNNVPEESHSASTTPPSPSIGTDPDEDEDPDEDDGPDLAARIAEARHTPAKDEYVVCWACDGEMTVDVGGTKMACAACRGEGRTKAGTPTVS